MGVRRPPLTAPVASAAKAAGLGVNSGAERFGKLWMFELKVEMSKHAAKRKALTVQSL